MAINLNVVKLLGLVRVLKEIKSELARMNELKEMELEHKDGIRTRIVDAKPRDLEETRVEYSHPEYGLMVDKLERQKGKELDEKEKELVAQFLNEDEED